MSEKFDVTVIGSGPGGYVAAIRCAQLGKKTAIIEKRETLGGTCLNVGCIPSKALLDSSEKYEMANHHFAEHGIKVGKVDLDLKTLLKRKDQVVSEVTQGVDFLMKKNKITRFHGFGQLAGKNEIKILDPEGKKEQQTIESEHIILATGSVPIELPGIEIDGKNIVTSDHAINLQQVPKHMTIIGAGVIGLELGSVWRRLGAKVTVVELLPRLLGTADKQMSSYFQRILTRQGIEFMFEHKVTSAKAGKGGVEIQVAGKDGKEQKMKTDVLLVAVGRRPYTDSLGLEAAGVELTERKRIKVDEHFRTSQPNIYAIGDVVDGPMLAHKAEDEGVALAELIAGQSGHVNYFAIPWVVYTWPEVAYIGYGEEELKEQGIAYNVGKSYFKANGRAKAMAESDGMVKILADKQTDKVLGVFIVGANASELISEAAVAAEFGASAEDIARSVHAHPTLAEVVKDASQNVGGWAIHQ